MSFPMPANEVERLAALAMYRVLDTPPEVANDAAWVTPVELRT